MNSIKKALKFLIENPIAAVVSAVVALLSYLGFKLMRAETERDEARHELIKTQDDQRLQEIAQDLDEAKRLSAERKKKAEEALRFYVDHKSETDN